MLTRLCSPTTNAFTETLWTLVSPASIFFNFVKLLFFYLILKTVKELYFSDFTIKREWQGFRDSSKNITPSPYCRNDDTSSQVKIYLAPIAKRVKNSHSHRT